MLRFLKHFGDADRQFEFVCVVGDKGRGNPMVLIMGLF